MLSKWTKRPVPIEYLTVPGAANKCCFALFVIEVTGIAVKNARSRDAAGRFVRQGGVINAVFVGV